MIWGSKKIQKNEQGRSMLEIMAVLAIMGIITMGGMWGYSVVKAKLKANEIDQLVKTAKVKIDSAAATKKQQILKVKALDGTPVSLRDATNYKNAGIRVDFEDDVAACKQFMQMYQENSEFYVLNRCDDEEE